MISVHSSTVPTVWFWFTAVARIPLHRIHQTAGADKKSSASGKKKKRFCQFVQIHLYYLRILVLEAGAWVTFATVIKIFVL